MIIIKRYNPNDSAVWNAFVDPSKKGTFMLKRQYQGQMFVPRIWRYLDDFSSGSVCLVLASEKYDEDDYIRQYDEFLKYRLE